MLQQAKLRSHLSSPRQDKLTALLYSTLPPTSPHQSSCPALFASTVRPPRYISSAQSSPLPPVELPVIAPLCAYTRHSSSILPSRHLSRSRPSTYPTPIPHFPSTIPFRAPTPASFPSKLLVYIKKEVNQKNFSARH